MNVQKLKENVRFFMIIKQNFSSNTKRKSLFPCTSIILDPDMKMKEMDQNTPLGGLIGSCMIFFPANSKIFRLQTILHDSAGSKKSTTKKDLDIVM